MAKLATKVVHCLIPGKESSTLACDEHAMEATNCNLSNDYDVDDYDDSDIQLRGERALCDYCDLLDSRTT